MCRFTVLCVESCEYCWRSSRGRDLLEACRSWPREDEHTIFPPRASRSTARYWTDPCRSTFSIECRGLQPSVSKEGNGSSVRREKWLCCADGGGHHLRIKSVEAAEVEVCLAVNDRGVCDLRSIRGYGEVEELLLLRYLQ